MEEMENNLSREEEEACIQSVDMQRITLVDQQDEEYEFIILDEFDCQGKSYLALASCDEKTDNGTISDPGESNDITVVRKQEAGGEMTLVAVTDADELLAVSKVIEARFGHLGEGPQED